MGVDSIFIRSSRSRRERRFCENVATELNRPLAVILHVFTQIMIFLIR